MRKQTLNGKKEQRIGNGMAPTKMFTFFFSFHHFLYFVILLLFFVFFVPYIQVCVEMRFRFNEDDDEHEHEKLQLNLPLVWSKINDDGHSRPVRIVNFCFFFLGLVYLLPIFYSCFEASNADESNKNQRIVVVPTMCFLLFLNL